MYQLIQLDDNGFKELSTYDSLSDFDSDENYTLNKRTFLIYTGDDFLTISKDSQTKIIQEVIEFNDGRVVRFSSGVKIEKAESNSIQNSCGHACWCVVTRNERYCETCYPMNIPGCDGLCCWILRCASTC